MRRVSVHGVERLAQLLNPAAEGIALLGGEGRGLVGGGHPSRLSGREPVPQMRLHGTHAPLVLGGVEARPTLGPGGLKQAVAPLPGA